METARYLERIDDKINLLRPPDVMAALGDAGFDAGLVLYTYQRDFHEAPIHKYWTDSYSEDELFLANALIYGPTK